MINKHHPKEATVKELVAIRLMIGVMCAQSKLNPTIKQTMPAIANCLSALL